MQRFKGKLSHLEYIPQTDLREKVTDAKKAIEEDELKQNDALLRYHYPNININELNDDEWAELVAELQFVLTKLNVLQKKD